MLSSRMLLHLSLTRRLSLPPNVVQPNVVASQSDTLLGCWPAECCCISVCHLWLYQLLSSRLVIVAVTQSHQSFHSLSHNFALPHLTYYFRSRVLVAVYMAMAISISFLSFSLISESTEQHIQPPVKCEWSGGGPLPPCLPACLPSCLPLP